MNLITFLAFVGSLFLGETMGNVMRSTWPPIYNPGEACLPYDGSKVPDCHEFIDPTIGEPYYHPHSFNCSRFWECGPTYETCLFECARCNGPDFDNPMCQEQWALTFDPEIQYPFGPVCKWPGDVDCDNDPAPCDCLPWQSCVNDLCTPQCTLDSHCPNGYTCDDCNWCIEGEAPGCQGDDSNCLQGECDVPWPYSTCEYCDGAGDSCLPGCSSDANCPELYPVCGDGGGDHLCGCSDSSQCPNGYICDTSNNVCTPGCQDDSACLQEVCDVPSPYSTCEYCDGASDSCLPGCSSNANCPALYPVCGGGGDHLCGCSDSSQCPNGYICDTSNHVCTEDLGCNGNDMNCKHETCDEPSNWPYTTCEYCDDTNGKDCIPGCSDDTVCPGLYPVCGSGGDAHRCGCNTNADCSGLGNNYICDTDNHVCTPGCSDDSDCPSEVCDIENTPYTTCTHCDNLVCVPGCTEDHFCPTGFECVNWLCEVKPAGYILLDSITVTGAGAGPYSFEVVGYAGTAHPATCSTEQLSGSGVFTGDDQLGEVLHHGCYLAPLNAHVSSGTVVGGESWTGASACFDWNDDEYFTYTCNIVGGKLVDCSSGANSVTC